MDARTVPVRMTTQQATILLEALRTSTHESYPMDEWEQLQDIKQQIETVSRRVSLFYET